ncbi:MAG TPA: MarC family protein [Mycobacteriales bacterium]|nr:MarC family protein [Mycobacteriales bacterium]
MTVDARLCGEVFVTLTVIMDPLGTVPIFLGLTAGRPVAARRRLAWQAVLVAGLVIGTFAIFGQQILGYLGITLPALQGAGGLLLVLVALELLRGGASDPEEVPDVNVALVPLGTPLLAGPGAIAATIVFVREASGAGDVVAIALGLVAVHVVLWLVLRFSGAVLRVVGEAGIHLLTRILGLLLTAIAVQLVADSVRAFVRMG